MKEVRVRFAPSPTGYLHIGGLRTALYDYLYARHTGGKFILRIEDTDRSRFVPGAIENLIESLEKLGLHLDEGPNTGGDAGPYTQSERLPLYQKEVQRLLENGHAYRCFCTSDTLTQMREEQQSRNEFVKYDRRCLSLSESEVNARINNNEPHTIRLKMPDDRIFSFDDIVRGHVEMHSMQSDDQVLLKSDGFPTYHLAAVVDDHYMRISHVIRGEEWLSSTPKHIWLYECLGWQMPLWVHLPLILNPDKTKLSKRMNDVSVESYLNKGYLKEALLNFVALLGWHGADDREIYSLNELCAEFSLERVNKSGAVFDIAKLDWMNGWYLRNLPIEEIIQRALPYFESVGFKIQDNETSRKLIEVARERCTLLPEIVEYSRMFLENHELSEEDRQLLTNQNARAVLSWYKSKLEVFTYSRLEDLAELVKTGMSELGIKGKDYYTPLRLAFLGQPHGPDIPTIITILGMQQVVSRLNKALSL